MQVIYLALFMFCFIVDLIANKLERRKETCDRAAIKIAARYLVWVCIFCVHENYTASKNANLIAIHLLQTFQIKQLGHAVKESSLHSLITELLLWLLDERVSWMDDGSQLLKALNVLMLKILVKYIS